MTEGSAGEPRKYEVGDTVGMLVFVGPHGRWRRAAVGALLCGLCAVPGILFFVLVSRGVIPADMEQEHLEEHLRGRIAGASINHWYVAIAWVLAWAIGVVIMLNRMIFFLVRRPRVVLTRVHEGWEVSVPTGRAKARFTLPLGATLHVGHGRLLGLRASRRPTHLIIHAGGPRGRLGERCVQVATHARRDEMSLRDAVAAIESTGGRVVIAEVDSHLRTDV